jgi:hypothetical protein
MYVVALAHFEGDPATDALPLASLLGASAYDVRLWLKGLLPRVVFRGDSMHHASSVLGEMVRLGHGALACHSSEVVPSASMVRVRRFLLDDLGISADGPESDSVGWQDIRAIIHVVQRTAVERTTRERVVLPTTRGGAVTVDRDRTNHEHDLEHAMYLFLREGRRPWCMRERDARYVGLGDRMGATSRENFDKVLALVRARATRARFDDRFALGEMPVSRDVAVRGAGQPEPTLSVPRESDLSLHLLVTWLTRDMAAPYRASAGEDRSG